MQAERAARVTAAVMREFGVAVVYVPQAGDAIDAVVVRRTNPLEQPSDRAFFADIEIDPAVIVNPRRKDEVEWADGTRYVVNKVHTPTNLNPILSLHRKADLAV